MSFPQVIFIVDLTVIISTTDGLYQVNEQTPVLFLTHNKSSSPDQIICHIYTRTILRNYFVNAGPEWRAGLGATATVRQWESASF